MATFDDGLHFEIELTGEFLKDLKTVVDAVRIAKKELLDFKNEVSGSGAAGGASGAAKEQKKRLTEEEKELRLTKKIIAQLEKKQRILNIHTANPRVEQLRNENKELREQLKISDRLARAESRIGSGAGNKPAVLSTGQTAQAAAEAQALKAIDRIEKERLRTKTILAEATKRGTDLSEDEKIQYKLLERAADKLARAERKLANAKEDVANVNGVRQIDAEATAVERLSRALDKQALREAQSRTFDERGQSLVSLQQEEQAHAALAKIVNKEAIAKQTLELANEQGVKLSDKQRLAIGGLSEAQERLLRAQIKLRQEREITGDTELRRVTAETAAIRAKNLQLQRAANLAAQQGIGLRRPQADDRLRVVSAEQRAKIKDTIRGLERVETAAQRAARRTKELNKDLKKTNREGNRIGFTFRRLFGIFAAFAAVRLAVRGFINLIKEGVRFNSQIESAELGIGALITAVGRVEDPILGAVTGMEALNLAQVEAARQMGLLRREALRTAATYQDLLEAFKTALAPGVQAGLDLDEIRRLSISISQAAGALGLPQQQLAEEIRSLLQGTITPRNTRIATALGITNEDIQRAKEAGELAAFLEKRFSAFGVAADKALDTFAARLTNAKDALSQLIATGQVQFFNELKDILEGVSDSIADISGTEVTIKKEALTAATAIGEALTFGVQEARRLAQAVGFESLTGAATTLAAVMKTAFTFLSAVIEGAVKGLQTISSLASGIVDIFKGVKILPEGDNGRRVLQSLIVFATKWGTAMAGVVIAFDTIKRVLGVLFSPIARIGKIVWFAFLPKAIGDLTKVQKVIRFIGFGLADAAVSSAKWVRSLSLLSKGALALAAALAVSVKAAKDFYDTAAGADLSIGEAFESFLLDAKLGIQGLESGLGRLWRSGVTNIKNWADAVVRLATIGFIEIGAQAVSLFERLTGRGGDTLKKLRDLQKQIKDDGLSAQDQRRKDQQAADSAAHQTQLANEKANADERGLIAARARDRIDAESGGPERRAEETRRQLDAIQESAGGLRLTLQGGLSSLDDFADKLLEIAKAADEARAALDFSDRTRGFSGTAVEGAQILEDSNREALKETVGLSKDLEGQRLRLLAQRVKIRKAEREINAEAVAGAAVLRDLTRELDQAEKDRLVTIERLGSAQITADGQTGSLKDLSDAGVDLSISDSAEAAFLNDFDLLIAELQKEIDKQRLQLSVDFPDAADLNAANAVLDLRDEASKIEERIEIAQESRLRIGKALSEVASLRLSLLARESVLESNIASGALQQRLVTEQRVVEARERIASLERSIGVAGPTGREETERLTAQLALQKALLDAKVNSLRVDQQAARAVTSSELQGLKELAAKQKAISEDQSKTSKERLAAETALKDLQEQIAAATRKALLEDKQRSLELAGQTAEVRAQKLLLERDFLDAIREARLAEKERLQTLRHQSAELANQAAQLRAQATLDRVQFEVEQGGATRTQADARIAKAQEEVTRARLAGLAAESAREREKLELQLEQERISLRSGEGIERILALKDLQVAREGALTEELRQQEEIARIAQEREDSPVSTGAFQALQNFSAQASDTFQNTLDIMTSAMEGFSATASDLLVDALAGTGTTEKTRQAFGQLLRGLSQQILQQLTALGTSKLLSRLFGRPEDSGENAGKELTSAALKWAPVATTLLIAAKLLNKSGGVGSGVPASGIAAAAGILGGYYGGPVTPRGFHEGGHIDKVVSRGSRAASRIGSLGGVPMPRGYAFGGGILPGTGLTSTTPSGSSAGGGTNSHPFQRPSNLHPADRVPIWAAVGEFMMRRASVSKYGVTVMKMINEGRIDPKALKSLALQVQFAGRPTPGAKIGFQTGGLVGGGTATETVTGTAGGGGSLPIGFIFSDESQMDQLLAGGEPALLRWLEGKQQFIRNLTS